MSDVHPLDCSDDEGDATAVSARASTQQRDQQVTDQERVPAAIEAPNVSPPPPDVDRSMSSFQTGQWTIRSVLILMVWIAIPLAIVAACGSSYYALAGMLIVGFVVCQFVAFVLAKLITLPMNYFIARQTVRYIQ